MSAVSIDPGRAGPDASTLSMAAKAALVLAAFSGGPGSARCSELAHRTGLSLSCVHRIVKELVEQGLLERRGYEVLLGLKMFELGARTQRPHEVRRLALTTMVDLHRATGRPVQLSVLEGREVLVVEALSGPSRRPGVPQAGDRLPAHATAAGKAMLARYPAEWLSLYLRSPLERAGPRTITSGTALDRELDGVRAHGTAWDLQESGPGLSAVAAALRRADGLPVGALSITGPAGAPPTPRAATALQAAAEDLNRRLRTDPHLVSP
ncbi:IclR family transcriptional regulator [Kocuria rosea]|uniref:IclR family transcriptional regulator n=1 Tax=Kocuria rosea TaxID=1275 RepID=UPI002559E399|nr:IclR family transcriptional regulator [Kocuria rosea]